MLTLRGRDVTLEPLTLEHTAALATIGASDRDGFAWTPVPGDPGSMMVYVTTALRNRHVGTQLPFAVVYKGELVGSTRFMDLTYWHGRAEPDAVEIGSTWYAPAARGTSCNPEAKLLLLTHAFDTWGCVRVTLKTDERNAASRAAISKLGARFEGIRRAVDIAVDATHRNVAYFSIMRDEWPQVRRQLTARLDRAAG
jgi:RimJ/RimL family protein N-acetyltransferase